MTRRKSELSSRTLDRGWPHQVAVPADVLTGDGHHVVRKWCQGRSVAPMGHSVVWQDAWWQVLCFRDLADADAFRLQFHGVVCRPQDRGRGRAWQVWRRPDA